MSSKGFLSQEVVVQQKRIFKIIGLAVLCAYVLLFVVETHFFREKIAAIVVGQTTASLRLLSMDGDMLAVQRTLDGVVQPFKNSFPISVTVTKLANNAIIAQTRSESQFYSLIQRQIIELKNVGLFEPVKLEIDIDISRLVLSSLLWAIVVALLIFAILSFAQKAISRGATDLLKPAEEFLIWFEKATESNLFDALAKPEIPPYLLSLENNITHVLTKIKDLNQKIVEGEKSRAQVDLSRQVAHDIRAPVAALKVALDELNKESAREPLQLITSAISRISSIADDLLLNGVEMNRDNYEYFRASESVKAIFAEKKATSIHCNFELEMSEELVVFGSRPYFLRALSNLINNAIEAKDKASLNVRVFIDKDCLTIQDDGKGMTSQTLGSLLSDVTLTSKTYGFGLGFSGAKQLLSKMGFSLEVESQVGIGTTIRLSKKLSA